MLVVDNGDAIRGIAEVASKLDYTVNGFVGTAPTQLADGQLGIAEADMYLSGADATVVASITVTNTDTSARTFTLYLKPSAGTSRAISPVSLDLGVGHTFYTDGQRMVVMNATGQVLKGWVVDDTPVDGEVNQPISSNWAYDHGAAADPHTGYLLESLLDAKGDVIAASADNTPARLAVGTDGQVLKADSGEATGLIWGTVSVADFQRFTSSGTWTKPTGVTHVLIECIGAGGGGGGGSGNTAGLPRAGGGGGAGGARARKTVPASTCGATETVTIGAAGAAGTGGSSGVGTVGGDGGTTSFGSILTAYGGGGGGRGNTSTTGGGGGGGGGTAGTGGTGGHGSAGAGGLPSYSAAVTGDSLAGAGAAGAGVATDGYNSEFGGASGAGSDSGEGAGNDGGSSLYGGAGGGSGGGLTTGNVETVGGAGGDVDTYTAGGGGTGGAVNGGAGGAGGAGGSSNYEFCGQGGGGGGSQDSGTGGVGGAGGAPGGGGGGGGGGTTTGGAGGVGGVGEVRVWSW